MFSKPIRTVCVIVWIASVLLGTTVAQVGGQDIGRMTMEMFRKQQTGQTELKARHEPMKGAPKRIWQEERDRQLQKEQPTPPVTEPIPPKPVEPEQPLEPGIITTPPVKADTGLPEVEPIEVTPTPVQPVQTATTGPAPDVLSLVPADCLFCVKIKNFDYAMGQLDSYLKGIIPIPMGLSLVVRGFVGGALGDPMLKNIQTNGDIAIFSVMAQPPGSQMQVPQFAVLVPVTDFQRFASENPGVSPPDPAGIYRINTPNSPLGELICTPVAEGQYALFSAVNAGTQLESVKALMTGTAIASRFSPDLQTQMKESPFWAYVNSKQVAQLVSTLAQAQQAQGQGSAQMQMALQQVDFLAQLQWLTLALDPSVQMLNAQIRMEVVPGSELSAMINKDFFQLQSGPNDPPEAAQMIALFKQMKKASQTTPATQALRTAEQADFVGAFNVLEMIGIMATVGMPQGQNQDPQMQQALMMIGMLSQMGQQLKTKMAMAVTIQDDMVTYELAIPKEHLVELIDMLNKLNTASGGPTGNSMVSPGSRP
ncbi:MAG: hypothetical protein JW828_00210 [Sedimentisphaerales bacterium]|nr:hypothetical protein [Sedimentisphaerales bacterium]